MSETSRVWLSWSGGTSFDEWVCVLEERDSPPPPDISAARVPSGASNSGKCCEFQFFNIFSSPMMAFRFSFEESSS